MTWGKFKESVEEQGVEDSDWLMCIDWEGDSHPVITRYDNPEGDTSWVDNWVEIT